MQAVAEEEFRLPGVKLLGGKGQRSRQIEIVRVEPAENISRRQRKAFIEGVSLTAILFTFPVRQVALVFLDDLGAVVGAPAVDDDVLQVRILLADHGQDRLLQETALVVGRRDYGDLLEGHQSVSFGD